MNNHILKTISHCNQQEYQWIDDVGFHQYYCDDVSTQTNINSISDFKYDETEKGRIYSWNDNLGFHQYHYLS